MLMDNLSTRTWPSAPRTSWSTAARGRAARARGERSMRCVRSLRDLGDDETLLVQSGKPVGMFHPRDGAPRPDLQRDARAQVGRLGNVRELEHAGLTMYGQMTASSWMYIGTQGILPGDLRDARRVRDAALRRDARRHDHAHGGLGGMGGARPSGRHDERRCRDLRRGRPVRIERRIETRYLDRETDSVDEALRWAEDAGRARAAVDRAAGQLRRGRARPAGARLPA